jgi:uncharacterized protein (DUF1015 family)
MANINPFRAIRPVRDKVHLVATRPYYSYKPNVLKAKLEDNPYTLLHIINPEFNRLKRTEANSNERFELVKAGYELFKEKGILIQDQEAHLYVYRQTCPDRSYTGIIGGADVEEYLSDHIKKHEATLTEREGVFTRYLDIVGLNAEPVLMSYEGTAPIDAIVEEVTEHRPEYEFTTTDLITHELWILSVAQSLELSKEFKTIDAVYIADGHHRSASSVALYEKYKAEGNHGKGQFFLAYFVREDALKILEFQRLVKHLNGLSSEEFIKRLASLGTISTLNTPRKPAKAHEITVYLNNTCYSLVLDSTRIDENHPTHSLDAELLTQWILDPILGISDLKTSEDIAFVPGNTPFVKVLNQVNDGSFKVAFFLFPIPMSAVKKVADHGMYMPPKSTWVEPKLRSGLTIMDIHD